MIRPTSAGCAQNFVRCLWRPCSYIDISKIANKTRQDSCPRMTLPLAGDRDRAILPLNQSYYVADELYRYISMLNLPYCERSLLIQILTSYKYSSYAFPLTVSRFQRSRGYWLKGQHLYRSAMHFCEACSQASLHHFPSDTRKAHKYQVKE